MNCRFCFDNDGNMIAPCNCKGSSKWVHVGCFVKWILRSPNPQRCEICNKAYVDGPISPPPTPPSDVVTYFDSDLALSDLTFMFRAFLKIANGLVSS